MRTVALLRQGGHGLLGGQVWSTRSHPKGKPISGFLLCMLPDLGR